MTKYVKLLLPLVALALLAGLPPAVSGQTTYDVSFSRTFLIVTEGRDSQVAIQVSVTPPAPFDFNIGISTSDATAVGGADYTSVNQTVQIDAQTARQVVRVEILDDLVYEAPESFNVNLTSTDSRITLGATTAEVSILNDELIEVALESEMIVVRETAPAQVCVVRVDGTSVTIASGLSFDMDLGFTDTGSALTSGQDNPTSVEINSTDTEWCASFTTVEVDQTTDVRFELQRTPDHPRDVRLSSPRFATVRVIDEPDCAANGAVTDTGNTDLVADCNNLLIAMEYLRGTATLNWTDSLAISSWEGIILSETPLRVTELNLGGKGLNGTIPPELGEIDRLRRLYLSGNALTGSLPDELNNLGRVEEFYLNTNRLSGEIPDLSDLGSDLGPTAIIHIRLQFNRLTGDIQDVNLPTDRIKTLYLIGNLLTGDPSQFLDGIKDSVMYGPEGLTEIRLSQNNFDTCIDLSLVEVLDDRARRRLGDQEVVADRRQSPRLPYPPIRRFPVCTGRSDRRRRSVTHGGARPATGCRAAAFPRRGGRSGGQALSCP